MGFLSRCCSRKGPHLTWMGESPGFSRLAAGNLGFLLSYDVDLRELLVLPQESPVSMPVSRGLLGFLSSRCQVLGPHLELQPEPQCSPSNADMDLGFLLNFNRGIRPHLLWRHASSLSSRALKVVSGFLWS